MYVVRSHITAGTIFYGHRREYDERSHISGGTICYGHRHVYVMRSRITGRTILLRASACVCCEISHHMG